MYCILRWVLHQQLGVIFARDDHWIWIEYTKITENNVFFWCEIIVYLWQCWDSLWQCCCPRRLFLVYLSPTENPTLFCCTVWNCRKIYYWLTLEPTSNNFNISPFWSKKVRTLGDCENCYRIVQYNKIFAVRL